MAHSWESPDFADDVAEDPGHAWEREVDPSAAGIAGGSDSEEDEGPDPERDPNAVADMFIEEMLSLYLESVISAQAFCVACYWAAKAGMAGARIHEYALRPGLSSGNYAKHLFDVLGLCESRNKLYRLSVPCASTRGSLERKKMELPFRPLHEIVEEHASANPSLGLRLSEALENNELPPCYTQHPVVIGSARPVSRIVYILMVFHIL